MIIFNVKRGIVHINKECQEEFNKWVLTTKDIVKRIKITKQSPIESERTDDSVKMRMLTSFFNDPSRINLRFNLNYFTSLKYGYGIINNSIEKIIMWFDDNGSLNFATFIEDTNVPMNNTPETNGWLSKIYVTDGDIFTPNKDYAFDYMCKLNNDAKKIDLDIYTAQELLNGIEKETDDMKQRLCDKCKEYFKLITKYGKLKYEEYTVSKNLKELKKQRDKFN